MNSRRCTAYHIMDQKAVQVLISNARPDQVFTLYGKEIFGLAEPEKGYQLPNIPSRMKRAIIFPLVIHVFIRG